MLKTDGVISVIKKNKSPMTFDNIWKAVGQEVLESITKELPEETVKSDLYFSMMEDQTLIMLANNTWDIREKYSLEDLAVIDKSKQTEETELVWEESEDTSELNLKIIYNDDNE